MKVLLLGALLSSWVLVAQAIGGPGSRPVASIAPFAGNRTAAISYTFDDNLRDQYTLAAPMLDEVGFKGTFFVIAGKTAATVQEAEQKKDDENPRSLWGGISWPELKKLSQAGHEIASHTWSHPGLTKLSPEDLDAQLRKACDAILEHIGKPALTIAFPGNASNEQVQSAALKYHVAYRAFQQSTSGKSTLVSLNAWADKLVVDQKWGVMMTHGISRGYAAMTDPEIFHDHLKHVKARDNQIWVDTFANIARYQQEREHASLQVSIGESRADCELTCPLDPARFDVPLTIVIPTTGATSATARRNGALLAARVQEGEVLVDAAPGAGIIDVTWSSSPALKN